MKKAASTIYRAWKRWNYEKMHKKKKERKYSMFLKKKINLKLSPYENAKLVDKRDFKGMIFVSRDKHTIYWILWDTVMERYLMVETYVPYEEVFYILL